MKKVGYIYKTTNINKKKTKYEKRHKETKEKSLGSLLCF